MSKIYKSTSLFMLNVVNDPAAAQSLGVINYTPKVCNTLSQGITTKIIN